MTLQRSTPSFAAGHSKPSAALDAAATSKVQLKKALRGEDLDTQVQLLSPGGAKSKSAGGKSLAKGGGPTGKGGGAHKSPGKPAAKGASKPAAATKAAEPDEGDPKQLILDQMAREFRAGEMAEYEELKANYEKRYGPVPGEGGEAAADEDKQQMEQLLGTYWRNGELDDFEALKKVYEKTYGAY